MSKFLPERKKLLEEVFEKASSETSETSFSGILKNLEVVLRDEFKITLSYKTVENYYKAIVKEEGDYPTKPSALDDLSKYLGFDNFNDYCSGWKSFEYKISQAMSKLVITVINKPMFKMPEFLTNQSNLGILGVLVVGGALAGNQVWNGEKKIAEPQYIYQTPAKKESEAAVPLQLVGLKNNSEAPDLPKKIITPIYIKKKECMYWDGKEYKAVYCDDINPQIDLIAIDTFKLKYLKKITRPDTLTTENAIGKVWYDKSNNNVEFFTSYGKHPENDKALKDVTERILNNYAGIDSK